MFFDFFIVAVFIFVIIFIGLTFDQYFFRRWRFCYFNYKAKTSERRLINKIRHRLIERLHYKFTNPISGSNPILENLLNNLNHITRDKIFNQLSITLQNNHRITNLLDNLSKINNHSYKYNNLMKKTEIDFMKITCQSLDKVRNLYKKKISSEAIEFDFFFNNEVYIVGDELYLGQVIENLVINTINYEKTNKTNIIKLRLYDSRQNQKNNYIFQEISPSMKNYINNNKNFVVFTIEDERKTTQENTYNKTAENKKNTSKFQDFSKEMNLELEICKSIILAHHGDIWIDILPNGLRFCIYLPV